MPNENQPRKVAIACQGGGSHAAFTAGVLRRLLSHPNYAEDFVITALSGTSGGAICAALAWSRLLHAEGSGPLTPEAERANGVKAAEALWNFWVDLACEDFRDARKRAAEPEFWLKHWPYDYWDTLGNLMGLGMLRSPISVEGVCKMVSGVAHDRMLELFRRHLPIDQFSDLDWTSPMLRLGATDILQGYSMPLAVEELPKRSQLHDAILASASIPPLFQPTQLGEHYFWDGLYSHNPPVDCFTNLEEVPDEIWVIQINPEVCEEPPVSMAEIVDRRNELSGNLSLAAELYHIDCMNKMLDGRNTRVTAQVRAGLRQAYHPIVLRVVRLEKHLDYASKFDRSWSHIEQMLETGWTTAPGFFDPASVWVSPEERQGYAAAVHPAVARSRGPGAPARHPGAAKRAEMPCPNRICPSYAMCATFRLPRIGEGFWDLAQKTLEYPEPTNGGVRTSAAPAT